MKTPDGATLDAPDGAAAFCLQQIGKPYKWGTAGPDTYDCSGLMQAAWLSVGVSIPRTTYQQIFIGTAVTYANAATGDLIFPFADLSHVVMYLGNGQVVQAPQTGESVNVVPYYGSAGGIRRVTDQVGTGAGINTGSLATSTGSASTSQGGAISQIENLFKTLEKPSEWASFGFIIGGAALFGWGALRAGAFS